MKTLPRSAKKNKPIYIKPEDIRDTCIGNLYPKIEWDQMKTFISADDITAHYLWLSTATRLPSRGEPGLKRCDAGWCKPHSRF